MRRIIIVGDSGSGKSTLGQWLARELRVPFIELDALFHLPEWGVPEDAAFQALVADAIAAAPDGWVIAGNYFSRIQEVSWPLADTVIWLDFPLRVTMPRVAS
jgi:adenylate kinase family enzyme